MITVENALKYVSQSLNHMETLSSNLIDATNHFLSNDIIAPINMPPFRQSAMDGYAVHLHDSNTYQLIGEVKAGDSAHPTLKAGEAVRIFTGAPVPDSANAVMMQEKVLVNANSIKLEETLARGTNIRSKGEQVQKDSIALNKGTKLTPAAIGFLASLGIDEVAIYKKPSIAIVTTGNELIKSGQPLKHGQIYESNSIMLLTVLQSLGFTNVNMYKVKDDYAATYEILQTAITNTDVVLITGGISVGDYDFVGKALTNLEVAQIFYKVKQKPGKPLFFGKKENTTVFALPGNPAAALSCFYMYVFKALQILSGSSTPELARIRLKSTSAYIKKGDRAQFLKAIVNANYVSILEGQSSAMLHTFALANALVYIPENTKQIEVNDLVEVILLPS